MSAFETGMIQSLRLVYASHGGPRAILRSGYFWVSLILTGLCWRSVLTESWKGSVMGSLPTLAGFSIAAYAILFAVLDERSRRALAAPEPELANRSPLLIIAGIVTHAVITQIVTLLYAFTFDQKPFPDFFECVNVKIVNGVFSTAGLFLFIYSVTLILASILTIFRVLEIRARV
jgi:hypothetical protein